jgi:hypothetical protein
MGAVPAYVVVASIDWHYQCGNEFLSGEQLRSHRQHAACDECRDKLPPETAALLGQALAGS